MSFHQKPRFHKDFHARPPTERDMQENYIYEQDIIAIYRISRKQAYDILKRNEQLFEGSESPIYYVPAMFDKKAQFFTDHEYNKIPSVIVKEDSRMTA